MEVSSTIVTSYTMWGKRGIAVANNNENNLSKSLFYYIMFNFKVTILWHVRPLCLKWNTCVIKKGLTYILWYKIILIIYIYAKLYECTINSNERK